MELKVLFFVDAGTLLGLLVPAVADGITLVVRVGPSTVQVTMTVIDYCISIITPSCTVDAYSLSYMQ